MKNNIKEEIIELIEETHLEFLKESKNDKTDNEAGIMFLTKAFISTDFLLKIKEKINEKYN